jgi:hypothetical protein
MVQITQSLRLLQRLKHFSGKIAKLNENYLHLQMRTVIICKNMKGSLMKSLLLLVLLIPFSSFAADDVYSLIIKEHRFQPAEVIIPAGKKVKLLIDNQDATPEEFESHSLNREKVIAGNSKATVYVGPLSPGRYAFEGEFNATTAQGAIIAQ